MAKEWGQSMPHSLEDGQSDEQKWRLSLLEAVNFFSVNIHGEQALDRRTFELFDGNQILKMLSPGANDPSQSGRLIHGSCDDVGITTLNINRID